MLKEIERDVTCSYCAIIESVTEKLLADTSFFNDNWLKHSFGDFVYVGKWTWYEKKPMTWNKTVFKAIKAGPVNIV